MERVPFEEAKRKAEEMADKAIEENGYPKATTMPVFKNQGGRRLYEARSSEIDDKLKAKYREYLVAAFLGNEFGYTPNGDPLESE